jgi:hypothetical protein
LRGGAKRDVMQNHGAPHAMLCPVLPPILSHSAASGARSALHAPPHMHIPVVARVPKQERSAVETDPTMSGPLIALGARTKGAESTVPHEARSLSRGHLDLAVHPIPVLMITSDHTTVSMFNHPIQRIPGSGEFLDHQFDKPLADAVTNVALGDAVGAAVITKQFHLWIAFGIAQSNLMFEKHGDTACQQCSGWTTTTTDIPVRTDLQSTKYRNAAAWYQELSSDSKAQILRLNHDKTISSVGYYPSELLHLNVGVNGTVTYPNKCAVGDHVCVQCATLAFASAQITMTTNDISCLTNAEIRNILQTAINTPMAAAAMDLVCPKAIRRESTSLWHQDGFLAILQHSAEVCPFNREHDPVRPYERVEVGTHPTVHADFWRVLTNVMTATKGQHRPAFGLTRKDTSEALQRITANLKREREYSDTPRTKGGKPRQDPDPNAGKGKKAGGRGGPLGTQSKSTKTPQ